VLRAVRTTHARVSARTQIYLVCMVQPVVTANTATVQNGEAARVLGSLNVMVK
jgi:hypothetical protein